MSQLQAGNAKSRLKKNKSQTLSSFIFGVKTSKAIGLFYGTTTGKTESVAEMIRDEFGGYIVTLHEFGSVENDDLAEDECQIIACPTWNIGEVLSD